MLVSTLVMAHLTMVVKHGHQLAKLAKRLECLYSKAFKLVSDGNNMTLQDHHDKNLAIMTFKSLNNLAPSYL